MKNDLLIIISRCWSGQEQCRQAKSQPRLERSWDGGEAGVDFEPFSQAAEKRAEATSEALCNVGT
jgi:hypothetical protein